MADQSPKLFDYIAKNAHNQQSPCKSKLDCLVLALHALMKLKQFKLVNCGEHDQAVDQDNGQLPASWNQSPGVYSFKYKHAQLSSVTVVVKAFAIDDTLSVHCTTIENPNQSYDQTLKSNDYVNDSGDYTKAPTAQTFKNVDKLTQLLMDQMISKLVPNLQASQSQKPPTQPQPKEERSPLQIGPTHGPYRPPAGGGYGMDDDPTGYFGVGGDDLNPVTPPGGRHGGGHLGGFGGGTEIGPHHPGFGPNITDPYRGGGDPFTGIPQRGGRGGGRGGGAGRGRGDPRGGRFDPFGPPVNPQGDPDFDDLPPPGYGDMFM